MSARSLLPRCPGSPLRRAAAPGLAVAALLCAGGPTAQAQSLTLLHPPQQSSQTTREFVNVLGRTEPGHKVRVAGEPVTVYATGVFVRDRLPLSPGDNRIDVEVEDPAGQGRRLTLEVRREPPAAPPAPPTDRITIVAGSALPQQLHLVDEHEGVEVGFDGTPGLLGTVRWDGAASGDWLPLVEQRPGQYRARLLPRDAADREPQAVQLRLEAPQGHALAGQASVQLAAPGAVGLWRSEGLRLWRTTASPGQADTPVTHGLHRVRLGGPFLAELPAGVLLRATGRVGEQLRVAFSPGVVGWVPLARVAPASPAERLPAPELASFSHLSVRGTPRGDEIELPWPAELPYAVQTVTTADGRLQVQADFFGGHLASTWISQRASAAQVREVQAEQVGPLHVRLRVGLQAANGRQLPWGWQVERSAGRWRLLLPAPPALPATGSPLRGLTVALEAGHGGPTNLGAVGATGVPEKDINRWTTDALAAELRQVGAQVVDVRLGDDNPSLFERAQLVDASQAQLFVSLHANAADTSEGYLRAAGSGMFYKHAHSRALAQALQRRLLEATGLPDLGWVGNFNYTPTRRVSRMPAVLVEQAFVSHPGEEALMLDPAFRARVARAIRQGLEDFLRLP
jgi:N-acetylmuramoyl-L-alanine amidase